MSKQNRVRATATRVYVVPGTNPCAGCKTLLSDKHFCYGCGSFVCDACDQTGVEGNHRFADHRRS